MTPNANPERVLAISAHPDDIDFGLGATVALMTAGGATVTYCIITSGDAGGYDPSIPRSEIPGIRQREQRNAAAVLGVSDIRWLGYKDGELTITHGLRRDLSRVIRQVRPDVVVVQSPVRNMDRMYASHPDHIAAGEAAMQAIYPDARNPFAHPSLLQDEGLAAWAAPETWVVGYPEPNHYVDVTDTFDRKVEALRQHVSQTEHMTDLDDFLREWSAGYAAQAGWPAGRLAEAFRVLDTA